MASRQKLFEMSEVRSATPGDKRIPLVKIEAVDARDELVIGGAKLIAYRHDAINRTQCLLEPCGNCEGTPIEVPIRKLSYV